MIKKLMECPYTCLGVRVGTRDLKMIRHSFLKKCKQLQLDPYLSTREKKNQVQALTRAYTCLKHRCMQLETMEKGGGFWDDTSRENAKKSFTVRQEPSQTQRPIDFENDHHLFRQNTCFYTRDKSDPGVDPGNWQQSIDASRQHDSFEPIHEDDFTNAAASIISSDNFMLIDATIRQDPCNAIRFDVPDDGFFAADDDGCVTMSKVQKYRRYRDTVTTTPLFSRRQDNYEQMENRFHDTLRQEQERNARIIAAHVSQNYTSPCFAGGHLASRG